MIPFIAGEDLLEATNSLLEKAIQLGLKQDKKFERLQAALNLEAQGHVLEVRSGNGLNLGHFSTQVKRLTGLDPVCIREACPEGNRLSAISGGSAGRLFGRHAL